MSDIASRYYAGLVGSWRGVLVVNAHGLRSPLSLVPLVLRTTLAPLSPRRFHHTTMLSCAGIALFASNEDIDVEDNRHFRMSVRKRMGLRRSTVEATGVIDEDARGALYRIPWGRETMQQRTRILGDDLELTQQLPWMKTRVLLHREFSSS